MRVLLLTPSLPLPALWGFNIRVLSILRGLAARHRVTLVCYGDPDADGGAISALAEMCSRVIVVPDVSRSVLQRRGEQLRKVLSRGSFHLHRFVTAQFQAKLTEVLVEGSFDFAQVESSAMAAFEFGNTPVVVDEHNLEYELLRRSNAVESSPVRRTFGAIEWRKVRSEETTIWRRAEGCVLTSDREQRMLNQVVPGAPTAVVPNGVALDYFRPVDPPPVPGSIVFTGLMTYRPNADGVRYFIRDVLPLIRLERPDVEFTAVGWGLPDDLRPLLGKGVTHTGRVDDVRPYLGRASVVVVPLRIGSGTRLKVLEALAMGKAVVSTKIGCEGLEVKHGEHLLIASDPAEFAKSVLRLMARPEDAAALGRRGRELVERRYGWDRSVARLHEFHESIFDARSSLSRVTAEAAAR